MSRHVELGHDANAALGGIGDYLPCLILGVVVPVRAQFVELGVAFALDAKPLIVGQVPVQHVDLNRRHGVEVPQNHLQRHPVAGDVEHQAPPGKARAVLNVYGRKAISPRVLARQLQ